MDHRNVKLVHSPQAYQLNNSLLWTRLNNCKEKHFSINAIHTLLEIAFYVMAECQRRL